MWVGPGHAALEDSHELAAAGVVMWCVVHYELVAKGNGPSVSDPVAGRVGQAAIGHRNLTAQIPIERPQIADFSGRFWYFQKCRFPGILSRFGALRCVSENRGVPGSSPGLATPKAA
jgi:hypothetical protein